MAVTDNILVMGVGNPLMCDEGVGPRVAELLASGFSFPDNVEVVDAGTIGFSILDLFMGRDHVIVIDAVKDTGHPAGTVVILTPEEIGANQVMHSLHDTRLVDVLQAAAMTGHTPQTICVGVQVESLAEWVVELTPACAEAIPIAAAAVLDKLRSLGVEPTPIRTDDTHAKIIEALRTYGPMPEESLLPEADSSSPAENPEPAR